MSINDDGINDFLKELTDMEVKIQSPSFKREVLEAMAEPVVETARSNASRRFKRRSGNLEVGIVAEWRGANPDDIFIGWTSNAFYGMMHERGYRHWKSKRFYKTPHMRPAFEANKEKAMQNGIDKAKELLN